MHHDSVQFLQNAPERLLVLLNCVFGNLNDVLDVFLIQEQQLRVIGFVLRVDNHSAGVMTFITRK